MANEQLSCFPPDLSLKLQKAKITSLSDVIASGPGELSRRAKLTASEAQRVLALAVDCLRPPGPITAWQIHCCCNGSRAGKATDDHVTGCHPRLTIGCPMLDRLLDGGIATGTVVEITGQSASGKTQLCMQLALTAQLPVEKGGRGAATCYISTEDAFPEKRLQQLSRQANQRWGVDQQQWLDHVYIKHVRDVISLQKTVEKKVFAMVQSRNVRLVIIDSVTALFRVEFGPTEMKQRSEQLLLLGHALKRLQEKLPVAVVVVNQVSDMIQTGSTELQGSTLQPALGLIWSNLIGTRLLLSRTDRQTVERLPDMELQGQSAERPGIEHKLTHWNQNKSTMHRLAHVGNVVPAATNQQTAVPSTTVHGQPIGCKYHDDCVCHDCEPSNPTAASERPSIVRYINVLLSPSLARGKVPFCVTESGVHYAAPLTRPMSRP